MNDVKYIILILARTSIYYGLIVLLLLFSNTLLAQTQFNTPKNALKWLWGTPEATQLNFFPIGYHFTDNHDANNKQWLIGGVYQGITAATFINTWNNRVYYVGIKRQVYKNNYISISYLVGIMQGYRGNFKKALGPVLGHDPGPLVAVNLKYYVMEHFTLELASYGVGGLIGASYIF
ncbi:hypothetical protein LEAN103870_09960 [Legionella anisa]|uniref:DUF3575 domain-containing protein n=1 Tax=Legionella anisa TaxID=28082 RepID=A0AAX0WUP6_9GAMM|nr:hypothetical protein [Legionella anisa]AWN74429.1 hypothetical protein DLD14_11520 [Legionella anisa]KTC71887.1 hypothetical protein Lani_1479 [Legionella anisa]MBN5935419.1 hypothetical protein [Legionella anisa]MCW8425471.1 hypothetical protein [Legionella anisa]MCW8449098.1 hypothetical protein [Legionella anisa]